MYDVDKKKTLVFGEQVYSRAERKSYRCKTASGLLFDSMKNNGDVFPSKAIHPTQRNKLKSIYLYTEEEDLR